MSAIDQDTTRKALSPFVIMAVGATVVLVIVAAVVALVS